MGLRGALRLQCAACNSDRSSRIPGYHQGPHARGGSGFLP